ncbi:MAG: hypothetical protein GX666_04985, partial [Tissierellia bacterium]|nr:hypothetical protein [Tissierellia bacterium]
QITTDIENVLFKYDIEKLYLLNSIRSTLVLRNHPNVTEEIEKLSKQNVAIIKGYQETLNRTTPDIMSEFISDGKETILKEEAKEEELKEAGKIAEAEAESEVVEEENKIEEVEE